MNLVAGKGEVWVCGLCQSEGSDRAKMCHPVHSILCEKDSIVREPKSGRVVECAQVARQTFRAAKAVQS